MRDLFDLSGQVRRLAWASIGVNVLIAVTGGAVRLTGSGLGCPTWPRCTDESFRPHGELGLHGAIEFGNRLLTFAVAAVAIATFVAAWQTGRRPLRRLALFLALGVPAQAVIGGITVLTGLNSWIVGLHLLVSMAMVSLAVVLLHRLDHPQASFAVRRRGPLPALAWSTYAAGWVVLAIGVVVTGAGPHAGDLDTPRNGLDPVQITQLHADAVFLLIGLTFGLLLAARVAGDAVASRAALVLLVVELAQGTIGFVQYFTDLPELLVGFHILGAGVLAAVLTWALLRVLQPAGSSPTPGTAARTAERLASA